MSTKRCYYEVLQVGRSASGKQISDAYRKLAIKYHPDKNPGNDEAVVKFKEAAEAFEVLHDSEKRALYDRHGHAAFEGGRGGGSNFTDINDIFSAFGDIFADGPFADLFGGGRGGRRRSRQGNHVQTEVTLDLLEAARGCRKTLTFKRHKKCETCEGNGCQPGTKPEKCKYCGGVGQVVQSSGFFRVQTACPACHGQGVQIKTPCKGCRGEGYVLSEAVCEVPIPAGVDDGVRLALRGEGDPSPDGGPPGDCYCLIHVKPHSLFQREGQHLICQVPISYTQAALGTKLEVPTLEGRDNLTVPAGTQTGEVFVLRGKGMPNPRGGRSGDLHVQVHIETPKKLTPRQEELLRELAQEEHANVDPRRKSFFETLKNYFVSEDNTAKS